MQLESATRKIYKIISFFKVNCINAIGSHVYTVLGNGNKKVHHIRSFSCDREYFMWGFFSEVSHGTTQLYTFTLFHSVLLHVTIHKF